MEPLAISINAGVILNWILKQLGHFASFHFIIFTLRQTPLLWTLTMLRVRVGPPYAYSANHDDPPTLTFLVGGYLFFPCL